MRKNKEVKPGVKRISRSEQERIFRETHEFTLAWEKMRSAVARTIRGASKGRLTLFPNGGISPIIPGGMVPGAEEWIRIAALDMKAEGLPQTTFKFPIGPWPQDLIKKSVVRLILKMLREEIGIINKGEKRRWSKEE